MARVGLIGVGDMGSGLARNLLAADHEVTLYDVRPEQVEPFVKDGARAAATPKELGEHCDYVFVMVMNSDQIMQTISGEDGLIASLKPGSTFICTATIERTELIEVAKPLAETGIHVVDSPVSGGAPGAASGTLTMMVAANPVCSRTPDPSSRRSARTSSTWAKRSVWARRLKPPSPFSWASPMPASLKRWPSA